MELLIGGIIGGVVGAAIAGLLVHGRSARRAGAEAAAAAAELAGARASAEAAESARTELTERLATADGAATALRTESEARGRTIERLEARLEAADAAAATERTRAAERLAEQRAFMEQAEKRLEGVFATKSREALGRNSETFMQLAAQTMEKLKAEMKGDAETRSTRLVATLQPFRELLEKQSKALGELEVKREQAYAGLRTELGHIAQAHQQLGTETSRLVTALRRPEQRGRWGEMQLRNAVEMAGMSVHCDFQEQPQTDDPTTRDRPDMIVRLPGGGVIVVDSKVALDAYLDSIDPDADRDACLERHARQVETHRSGLSKKAYWDQFDHTPQLVVMFMPVESALVAALEKKPDLHADAMRDNVLIATPTLLVALLRAVAYGWQQEATAANAKEVAEAGRDLYKRLATFADHLGRVGRGLKQAGEAYNKSIGSLERTVLPAARRFRDLEVITASEDEVIAPPLIETEPRPIVADELLLPVDPHDEAAEPDGR